MAAIIRIGIRLTLVIGLFSVSAQGTIGGNSTNLSDYIDLDDWIIRNPIAYGVSAVPYRSFADSTFAPQIANSEYFYLETFEDGALNTPGIKDTTKVDCLGCSPFMDDFHNPLDPFAYLYTPGYVRGPGAGTDSVDLDDGSLDGWGNSGHSYHMPSAFFHSFPGVFWNRLVTHRIEFQFDETQLGELPDSFGFAWTDGAPGGSLRVQIVDSRNVSRSYSVIQDGSFRPPLLLGDDSGLGTTAEDRFVGITSSTGIRQVTINYRNTIDLPDYTTFPHHLDRLDIPGIDSSTPIHLPVQDYGFEIDHVQYGRLNLTRNGSSITTVPEPGTVPLVALGCLLSLNRRRNRI